MRSTAARILKLKAWKELADINMQAIIFAVLYILVATQAFSQEKILASLLLLGSLAAYLCYGVLVNDYCDMPSDIKAGKRAEMLEVPQYVLRTLIIALFVTSFLLASIYVRDPAFFLMYGLTFFLATFYSAYPLRFKERGALGIVGDVLIEKTLPLTMVLVFFSYLSLDALLIVLFFSVMQLKLILDHQIFDYEADLASGVDTFTTKSGLERSEVALKWLIRPTFVLGFILLCISMYVYVPYSFTILLALLIGYLTLKIMARRNIIGRVTIRADIGNWITRIPFYDGYITASLGVLLLFLILSAMLMYPLFVLLLPLTIISQLYIIRGHYFRIFRSFFKLFSQKLRPSADG